MVKISNEAKGYWKAFGVKCLENFASAKVWFFMLPFLVSTVIMIFLINQHLEFLREALTAIVAVEHKDKLVQILQEMKTVTDMFIAWCTFTVSLAGTIVVVREVFKVKKLTALNDEDSDNSEKIEKMNT